VASDHQLLIGSVHLKVAALKVRDIADRLKFNTDKLKSKTVRKSMEKETEKIIQQTQYANECTETALLEASEEILGRRKTSRKEWISDDIWGRIAKRKETKGKLLNAVNETEKTNLRRQYRGANKLVKNAARKDKRTWVESLAQAAQNAADLKNSRELYRITRQLAKKSFTNAASLVRGKDCNQLRAVEEQVQRWQEHFGEVLSAPAQEREHDLNTTQHPNGID